MITEEKKNGEPLHIFLIAGEASGDALGAALMRSIREKTGACVRFSGIGGAAMEGEGLVSLFPMQELSVMGLAEVLPKLNHFLKRIKQTVDNIEKSNPDILVTIDSPDFCLRVARAVHRRVMNRRMNRVRLVHYVAPSVWAWRPGRAKKIAQFLDGLICLLPFEPAYFEKEGLKSVFAGHPVVDGPFTRADGARFRALAGIDPRRKLLCLLPGSRRSEIARTGAILVQAASRIAAEMPGIGIVVPTLPHLRGRIKDALKEIDKERIFIVDGVGRADAFAACDAALATSGTVGLELAAAGVPHVIAYRMNPVTWQAVRRMVRVRYAHLVNILLDAPVVPEFLQAECTADRIAPVVMDLLRGGAVADGQKCRFAEAMAQLGQGRDPSPADRAARFVLEIAGRRRQKV